MNELQNIVRVCIMEAKINKVGASRPATNSHTQIRLLTRKEVGKFLHVSTVTVDAWVSKGLLKAYRIGVNVRFKAHEIEDALTLIPTNKGGANG
jgi:excisionase family DNA binding protein